MKKKNSNRLGINKNVNSDLLENLGLDADGSSDVSTYSNLNSDNDRISGNPDGEDDQHNTTERPGSSLLDDK